MMNFGIFELVIILLMILFWALIIGGAIWLVVTLSRGRQGGSMPQGSSNAVAAQTPLDILRMRYAKGEISKEQFEQMRRDIQ